MQTFGMQFGKLVRDKRGIEGLSQDALAERSGLTKARISDLETGKISNPQIKTVDALCVALNISQDERGRCHANSVSSLPVRLLEKLAQRFGRDMPDATEDELEAFLVAKAEEFREMRGRLKELAEAEGRISELINAANTALGEGEFGVADSILKEAERVQYQSNTIVALRKQAKLRIERGNAALINGDVASAAGHFESSSQYFSGIDVEEAARNRYECVMLLRFYGYRYRNCAALYEARKALDRNLAVWKRDAHTENWCETKNALGGVYWRLSQFDLPEHTMSHLNDAKHHYEEVYSSCSEEFLPKRFGAACLNLANIYSDRHLAASKGDHEKNLQRALSFQLAALPIFSKSNDPEAWGILQHNLGCSYTSLSNVRADEVKSASDLTKAIEHLELSFEVRKPDHGLQYWVASSRSLGEALLNMSMLSVTKNPKDYVRRASIVLKEATEKISSHEHPHQWAEIQLQLSRCNQSTPRP